MSVSFLPSNAGPADKALAYIWDSYRRFAYLIKEIKHIGVTYTPDDWVPHFIWERGLEDILPYVTNMQMALAEGPRWQRIRGTQTGIEMGVGWVDITAKIDPPDQRLHWSQFQLELPETVHDLDHIKRIDGIARLSKAAEDSLYRLFNPVRDHRPIRMNRHKFAGGRFNGYSGDRLWPDGPLISFAIALKAKPHTLTIKAKATVASTVMVALAVGKITPRLGMAQALPMTKLRSRRGWPVRWSGLWHDVPVMVRSKAGITP